MDKIGKDIVTSGMAQQALNVVWPLIRTRSARIVLLSGVIGIGLFFNWSWLVAAGVAPIILGILPCAVMCTLGLCMQPGKKGACLKKSE